MDIEKRQGEKIQGSTAVLENYIQLDILMILAVN